MLVGRQALWRHVEPWLTLEGLVAVEGGALGLRILWPDDIMSRVPGYELALYLVHGHEVVWGALLAAIFVAKLLAVTRRSENWRALFCVAAFLAWGAISLSLVLYSSSPLGAITFGLFGLASFVVFLRGPG